MEDITKTGIHPMPGIRLNDGYNDAVDKVKTPSTEELLQSIEGLKQQYRNVYHGDYGSIEAKDLDTRLSSVRSGSSAYDLGATLDPTQDEVQNNRFNSQSGVLQILNGVNKCTALATTTFLDSTAGLVYGLFSSINNGDISKMWDNDFSKAMQSINQASEEWLPNYYSTEQERGPWYSSILSANFWGDKVIKNLGFTIGTIGASAVTLGAAGAVGNLLKGAKALAKGSKAAEAVLGASKVGKTAKTIKAIENATDQKLGSIVNSTVGSFISAVNEGRVEALNNSTDWAKLQSQKQYDEFQNKTLEIQNKYAQLKEQYPQNAAIYDAMAEEEIQKEREALGKVNSRIAKDATSMGNINLSLNIPILFASNLVTFGKFFGGGFNVNKLASLKSKGKNLYKYAVEKPGSATKTAFTRAATEGNEEVAQKFASTIPGNYYADDVQSFHKYAKDPDSEQEQISMLNAIGKGFMESYGSVDTYEEFFIGALTGMMGVPMFKSVRQSDGSNKHKLTLAGNAWMEHSEEMKEYNRNKEMADSLNSIVQNPKFLNYYQSLIRDGKLKNDMEIALANNSAFDYKNAEFAQMVNAVSMFDKAGKLGDFQEMIVGNMDYSDENLESIIKNTTQKNEDGTLTGPYAQYASLDGDGNITINFGSEDNKKNMIDTVKRSQEAMNNAITDFLDTKRMLQLQLGNIITDDERNELTWMHMQINNWAKRNAQMAKEVSPVFNSMKPILEKELDTKRKQLEKIKDTNSDNYKKSKGDIESVEKFLKDVETLYKNQNEEDALLDLVTGDGLVERLSTGLDRLAGKKGWGKKNVAETKSKLRDMQKVAKAADEYSKKFTEYLERPTKLQEDNAKVDAEAQKNADNIERSKDVQYIMNTDEGELINQITTGKYNTDLDTLLRSPDVDREAKNKIQKVKEVLDQRNSLKRSIDDSDLSNIEKELALLMMDKSIADTGSLESLLEDGTVPEGLDAFLKEKELIDDDVEKCLNQLREAMDSYEEDNEEAERLSVKKEDPLNPTTAENDPVLKAPRTWRGDTMRAHAATMGSEIVNEAPALDSTEEDEKGEIANLDGKNEKKKRVSRGPNSFWKTSTTQVATAASRNEHEVATGKNPPYYSLLSNRDPKKAKYEILWKYQNDKGCFARINAGLVTKGTKVRIGSDKNLNSQIGHVVPLVYVETSSGVWEPIGDMLSRLDKFDQMPFYENFLSKVEAQVAADRTSENIVYTDIYLNTNDVLKGMPNFSEENKRRTLNEIADGGKILLGVKARSGRIIVDSARASKSNTELEDKVLMPIAPRRGQPYVLVGDENNGYMCVPIRMPKFNAEEAKNSTIGKEALRLIDKLKELDSMSGSQIQLLSKQFRSLFNFDHFWIHKAKTNDKWTLTIKLMRDSGQSFLSSENLEELVEIALQEFEERGVGYNIDIHKMNNPTSEIGGVTYNEAIGEIATTNLNDLSLINNFPIFDYFDNEGNPVVAKSPKTVGRKNRNYTASEKATSTDTIKETRKQAKARSIIEGIINYNREHEEEIRAQLPKHYMINGKATLRVHSILPKRWIGPKKDYGTDNLEEVDESKLEYGDKLGVRATNHGTIIDDISRQFFEIEFHQDDIPDDRKKTITDIQYDHNKISKAAFDAQIDYLKTIAKQLRDNNEIPYASNIIVNHDFEGVHVAGELDLITIDDKGNFRIYDFKTSYKGFGRDEFDSVKSNYAFSKREEYTNQLNVYADILEKEYGITINELYIIPMKTDYANNEEISKNQQVKYISGTSMISLKRDSNITESILNKYRADNNITKTTASATGEAGESRGSSMAFSEIEKRALTMPTVTSDGKKIVLNIRNEKNPVIVTANIKSTQQKVDNIVDDKGNPVTSTVIEFTYIDSGVERTAPLYLPKDCVIKEDQDKYDELAEEMGTSYNTLNNIIIDPTDGTVYAQLAYDDNEYLFTLTTNPLTDTNLYNPGNVVIESLPETKEIEEETDEYDEDEDEDEIHNNKIISEEYENKVAEAKISYENREYDTTVLIKGHKKRIKVKVKTVFDQDISTGLYTILFKNISNNNSDNGTLAIHPSYFEDTALYGIEGAKTVNITCIVINEDGSYSAVINTSEETLLLPLVKMPLDVADPSKNPNSKTRKKREEATKNAEKPVTDHAKAIDREEMIDDILNRTSAELLSTDAADGILDSLTDEQLQVLYNLPDNNDADKRITNFYNAVMKLKDNSKASTVFDSSINVRTRLVTHEGQNVDTWNDNERNAEIERIKKMVPGMSDDAAIKIVETLEEVAGKDNPKAWGTYVNGIITLFKNAERGTAYHEAFHKVLDLGFSDEEKSALFGLARQQYPGISNIIDLEEQLAEDFREYCLNKEKQGLLDKILEFFKELFDSISGMFGMQDSLPRVYRKIYRGKYKRVKVKRRKTINTTSTSDEAYNNFRKDMQSFLNNFNITIKDVEEFGGEAKLFDALNRTINIRGANDISEGVGRAIAFMMQYDADVKKFVTTASTGSPKIMSALDKIKIGHRSLGKLTYTYALPKSVQLDFLAKEISEALKDMYNLKPATESNSTLYNIISKFFKMISPYKWFRKIHAAPIVKNIVNSIKNNDSSLIVKNNIRPGEEKESTLLDIDKAIKENPYEASIIKILGDNNILLAGSASIAVAGTLYRLDENPMHDIDFNAATKSRQEIEQILKNEFKNFEFTNRISTKGLDRTTLTYMILDRPFKQERTFGNMYNIIDATTGELLGTRAASNLILKEGVKGKMLDFFIGKDAYNFGSFTREVDGQIYKFADYRGAMSFKVDIAREKDIWDYNRFQNRDIHRANKLAMNNLKEEDREALLKNNISGKVWDAFTTKQKEQVLHCIGVSFR